MELTGNFFGISWAAPLFAPQVTGPIVGTDASYRRKGWLHRNPVLRATAPSSF